MKTKLACAFFAVLTLGVLSGCSVGNQPQGASVDEIKATIAKKSPEEQIALIEHSPMPQAEKDKQIAAIKAKSGKK